MKVVQIEAPGKINIVDKEIPKRNKDEALLKIKYCGICGSDVAAYTGNQPFATYPRIPGHEFSAEIVEIDDNEDGLQEGMLVTAIPYFNCETCYPCQKGKRNCCENNETMGVQRDGSFSEYITMPVKRIIKAQGLSAQELALIEPFSISYHASKRVDMSEGKKVLVIGAGAIGLFALISAKMKNAEVYVCDVYDHRLEYAKRLGAHGVINAHHEDVKEKVMAITNQNGMDIVMEAVGLPETFLNAIEWTSFGGQIVLIGNGKRHTEFNHSVILKKELDIFGSRNSTEEMRELVELVKIHDIKVTEIVSDIVDFKDSIDAFEKLKNNDGTTMKVLIKFSE
ncbi:MAG: zinc-binding alcohol dehydrogenase family protein [Clostridia bacterium]|nr:zinc-binding alcohol dehydrogenase family protein [Clostridia bacterium]